MSKNRPRERNPAKEENSTRRDDPVYWRSRIFRSTYKYKGETRTTSKWYAKFQIAGKRRTVALESADAGAAAQEACNVYAIAVDEVQHSRPQPPSERAERNVVRMSSQHWKSRLLRRKYVELVRRQQETEWSVVIDHDHVRRLFPLGTMDVDQAAAHAAERFCTVVRDGWRMADLHYEQEFTIAIFWKLNPTICTYSTMLTIPASMASNVPQGGPATAIVVEPDEGTGRALRRWLSAQRGWSLRVISCSPGKMDRLTRREQPSIILVNQSVDLASLSKTLNRLSATRPDIPVYQYGVFEDSDGIFASLSGVSGGYILRRRPPDHLLDPIAGSRAKTLTTARAQRMIHRYFQSLVEGSKGVPNTLDEPTLTIREHEVMVFMAQGLQDKEIASKLDISTWTVNSHVRHIYRKFDVHGRTEAVVKFLEIDRTP